MESWAGHIFPGFHPVDGPRVMTTVATRQKNYPLYFQEPRILKKNQAVYNLYYDAKALFETVEIQEEGCLLQSRLYRLLHLALLKIDFTADSAVLDRQCLRVAEEIAPLLKQQNGTLVPQIFSIGNAHLDHAWLWPISETSRKCARTCANMAGYMEEFPEFRYLHSQPLQLLNLKTNYPEIFNRMVSAQKRSAFEPNGGMWVEADCNLSGGESLIRQFLLGRETTRDLFGYTGDVLWLPDVLGYTACLPQILKGCGIKWFVTSKISWNDTTCFPFDLFRWEGLDGSEIPSHFITIAYEGRNTPKEIKAAWDKVQHKDIQSGLLRSIGEGDGCGGTMRCDLEMMQRMENLQGLPANRWKSLSAALDSICPDQDELPPVQGRALSRTASRNLYHNGPDKTAEQKTGIPV